MSKKYKKRPAKKPVKKALSAEEATILSNIKSMVSELESIGAGEATMAEDEGGVDVIIGDDDEEEDEFAMKARDEGPSGRDKADERLEETDEESEKNITAVKAIITKMNSTIAKSKAANIRSNTKLLQAVAGLTKVVKSLNDRMEIQEEAIVNVVKGMGFGQEIEKSITPKKKVVQATDTEQVLKSLLGIVQENKEPVEVSEGKSQSNEVRKSLGQKNVLTALLGQ